MGANRRRRPEFDVLARENLRLILERVAQLSTGDRCELAGVDQVVRPEARGDQRWTLKVQPRVSSSANISPESMAPSGG